MKPIAVSTYPIAADTIGAIIKGTARLGFITIKFVPFVSINSFIRAKDAFGYLFFVFFPWRTQGFYRLFTLTHNRKTLLFLSRMVK